MNSYLGIPEFIEQLNNAHSKNGMEKLNWTSTQMTWEVKFNKSVIITANENWFNYENTKIYRQSRINTSKVCPYFLKGICGDGNNCNKYHPRLPPKLKRKNKYG